MPSPSDVAEILRKRHDWLPHLCEEHLTKPELCSVVGVSRSTVDRGITDMEVAEMVERTDDGYHLTPFGDLLCRLRMSYMRSVESICLAQPMPTQLPTGQHGEQVLFDGGDVILPEPHLPEKPTRRLLTLITESRSVRGFTPVMHDQYVSTSYEQVIKDELEFEFLITPRIVDGLVSMYAEWLLSAFERDTFEIYERTQLAPFGLAIFEREGGSHTVVLALYADNGLSGIVENDTRQAVGWATRLYREYKTTASRVDADFVTEALDEE